MLLWKTTIYCLTVVAITSAGDVSSVKDGTGAEAESQEYQEDLEKTISMEGSLRLDEVNDLAPYEQFADGIQAKWASKDKEYFARLILRIIRPLSSGRFGDNRQYVLARKYALSALGEPNKISLEMELELADQIITDVDHGPEGEPFAQQRRRDAEVRLHAWKRLTDTIDPNWDPNDRAYLSAPLPPGVMGVSGMAPQMISDPKQRAAYEEAIEKNRLKAERRNAQLLSRRWLKWFPPRTEKYIIRMYSRSPYNIEELNGLLMQSLCDKQTRTRILDAVQKKMRASPNSGNRGSRDTSSNSGEGDGVRSAICN